MSFFGFKRKNSVKTQNSRQKAGDKKRAVAFVDYEHWFISMNKIYKTKPDLKAWQAEISEKYNVVDIMFFADFSGGTLRQEIPRIREISNTIIETQNTASFYKKDFTDFIMLDSIYQRVFSSGDDNEAYIIFTGDGHFSSVVRFLVNRCKKEVGLYGVKDAMSGQLKSSATWYVELEETVDRIKECKILLLENFERLEGVQPRVRPTFIKTVEKVSEINNVDYDTVKLALTELIRDDYIYQIKERFDVNKNLNVLYVDWDKARQDGLFEKGQKKT